VSSSGLLISRLIQNGVKYIVFNFFNTKYGYVFKRPNLLLKFKAFAITAKKSIWWYITTNKYRGVKVIIANII
jgi:hypothetical protein